MKAKGLLVVGIFIGLIIFYLIFKFIEDKRMAVLWVAIIFMLVVAVNHYRSKAKDTIKKKDDIEKNDS